MEGGGSAIQDLCVALVSGLFPIKDVNRCTK